MLSYIEEIQGQLHNAQGSLRIVQLATTGLLADVDPATSAHLKAAIEGFHMIETLIEEANDSLTRAHASIDRRF